MKNKQGDKRFFCYLNKDHGKILGKFTKAEFLKAIEAYLSSNYNQILKPLLDKRDIYTGALIYKNQKEAVKAFMDGLVAEYL